MSDTPESSNSNEVPAQALPKRWQFIDASSNRLNNQTAVRRHVMQEYHMRQKRHRTVPSNKDSEVVGEVVGEPNQDSTPKTRRRSKKSKISDKNTSDEDRKEHDVIKSAQNIISLAMKSTMDLHQKSSDKSISDEDKKECDVTDSSQNIISLVRRSTRDSQQKTHRRPKKHSNEPPAPVRPSLARWQFIDSSSNSRSNLAKVKSHVMLEYNRQKREDSSSNKDGEAPGEPSQDTQ